MQHAVKPQIKNMRKHATCSKTSEYTKICNIRFGFWGLHNLIRKDPEFQEPITLQIEYANMQNSGLYYLGDLLGPHLPVWHK